MRVTLVIDVGVVAACKIFHFTFAIVIIDMKLAIFNHEANDVVAFDNDNE